MVLLMLSIPAAYAVPMKVTILGRGNTDTDVAVGRERSNAGVSVGIQADAEVESDDTESKENENQAHASGRASGTGMIRISRPGLQLDISGLKLRLSDCKGQKNPECEAVRADVRSTAEAHLVARIDHVLGVLTDVQAWIGDAELGAQEKAQLSAKLSTEIEALADIKADLMAEGVLSENEVREAISEARASIRLAKQATIESMVTVRLDKMGGILVKMDQLEKKMNKLIATQEERGADISSVAVLQAEFKATLDSAEKQHAEVQAMVEAGATADAAKKMRGVHQTIKEAHSILVTLWNNLKNQNNQGAQARVEADANVAANTGVNYRDTGGEAVADVAAEARNKAKITTEGGEDV